MRILVTGGAGFIGSHLMKLLSDDDFEIVSLDDYSSGTKKNEHSNCTYIEGDISEVSKCGKFDIIFHLAALSRIQPSFNNPEETYRVNTTGTQQVLEWARLTNAKVVYAGSSSKWHNPYQSPYAGCKYMGEEICKMYRETYGMNIQIARFYNVYGPGEILDGDWAAVIGIWRSQIRDGSKLTIVGDGEQRRDFTHVMDIVAALERIGFVDNKHQDAWELGSGVSYSINEVYEMFSDRFPNIESEYLLDQSGNYRKTLRENNDALQQLGWFPKDRLRDYILNL